MPKATPDEVEAIAKPAATLLARRPHIQNAVKKYAAPAVLLGAIGSYAVPRILGLRSRVTVQRQPDTRNDVPRDTQNGGAVLSSTAAPPDMNSSPTGADTRTVAAPSAGDAATIAAVAAFARNVVDEERSRVVQLG